MRRAPYSVNLRTPPELRAEPETSPRRICADLLHRRNTESSVGSTRSLVLGVIFNYLLGRALVEVKSDVCEAKNCSQSTTCRQPPREQRLAHSPASPFPTRFDSLHSLFSILDAVSG